METLAELLELARSPGWTGRLQAQWFDDSQMGAAKYGAGLGSIDARLDEGEVMTTLARRGGIGDDGAVRAVSVALKTSDESRKTYSRAVVVRMERAAVADILGAAAVQAQPAADDGRIARLEQMVMALVDAVKAPQQPTRNAVVDADPFTVMMRMQQFMAEQAREQRREFSDMLREVKAGATSSTPAAPVEVFQELGKLRALVEVKQNEGGPAAWAPIVAPILDKLGDIVTQSMEIRRDQTQLQMAMWAKANGLPLPEVTSVEGE